MYVLSLAKVMLQVQCGLEGKLKKHQTFESNNVFEIVLGMYVCMYVCCMHLRTYLYMNLCISVFA
jgi:hypothetical protein